MVSCGGGSSDSPPIKQPPIEETLIPVTEVPTNQISTAFFRDQNSEIGKLSGLVTITAPDIIDSDPARVESVWIYWVDEQGNKQGNAWLKTETTTVYDIDIPDDTNIPENINALLILPVNAIGQAAKGTLILFHDFKGNAELSGMGGNEIQSWEYGVDRPKISIQRTEEQGGLCIFDNGLVSVINMNNKKDEAYESRSDGIRSDGSLIPNEVNENAFPSYSFLCDAQPTHSEDILADEIGVWTYSTLNDAMFYGTVVYDSFLKYLGKPPLEEKIRIRVHYGHQYHESAYWDGVYANFGDGYPLFYSLASLDFIAHEVGHGVLNRISDLNLFEHALSTDARTLHEAFSDISAIMAKYEFTGHTDNWLYGQENAGRKRYHDQIETEYGAITSFLDYDDAGDNYYLRMGMFTYPFYLLSNQWGIEPTYKVYVNAAKNCWSAMTTLTEAAECIKQQAGVAGLAEEDVIKAFKTVKIKLFDEGVLSHFNAEKFKLRTVFNDNSQTTNELTQWLWDFGDGETSAVKNPEHIYAQAGEYTVTLKVTDQSFETATSNESASDNNGQDSFSRNLTVTDEYCVIDSLNTKYQITTVTIGNNPLVFDGNKTDYTDSVIDLNTPENIVINIIGNTTETEKLPTWKVWIDLNDNGLFGDTPQELLLNEKNVEITPYGLNTVFDFTDIPYDGEPKYMRFSGDYSVTTTPCQSGIGEAFDIKVRW
jgi:hypothetical protein